MKRRHTWKKEEEKDVEEEWIQKDEGRRKKEGKGEGIRKQDVHRFSCDTT